MRPDRLKEGFWEHEVEAVTSSSPGFVPLHKVRCAKVSGDFLGYVGVVWLHLLCHEDKVCLVMDAVSLHHKCSFMPNPDYVTWCSVEPNLFLIIGYCASAYSFAGSTPHAYDNGAGVCWEGVHVLQNVVYASSVRDGQVGGQHVLCMCYCQWVCFIAEYVGAVQFNVKFCAQMLQCMQECQFSYAAARAHMIHIDDIFWQLNKFLKLFDVRCSLFAKVVFNDVSC